MGQGRLTLEGVVMRGLCLPDTADRILCLGAHCDDVEIGCGATLVELARRWPTVEFHIVIFCSDEQREIESRRSLTRLIGDGGQLHLSFGRCQDSFLPYRPVDAKEFLVEAVKSTSADITFTHSANDLHQDHRFVAELTYQVIRQGLILEMEIPKYDGDLRQRNVYFPVSQQIADHKVSTLLECYASQSNKHWFSEETFRSLMRIRGIECKSESGLAEAFIASKIVIA